MTKPGKYSPLTTHLKRITSGTLTLDFTFGQIESILGDTLPPSARRERTWWGNTRGPNNRHVQAIAWLEGGWEVDSVDLAGSTVTFRRV